jgi:glutamine amidotransferase
VIGIVSYGVGNVQAFASVYERNGIPAVIAGTPDELRRATHLILPGVGAFDWAMERLNASGLRATVDELVIERLVPVLGVCVGMQMMADRSDEGVLPGLGWISGEVKHLSRVADKLPLPHMGWNDVEADADPLFAGTAPAQFYFLHSFGVVPRTAGASIARASYGAHFVCAVRQEHIAGVQFHPEKSHHWGERLLLNFASY